VSTTVIQHGLERTGTSLARRILQDHFSAAVNVESKAWKHGPWAPALVPEPLHEAPVAVTVRHPLNHLVSVYRWRRKTGETRTTWKKWIRYGSTEQPWVLRMWNFAYGYWREKMRQWSAEGRPHTLLRLEDLLREPACTLRRAAMQMRLGEPRELRMPDGYLGPRSLAEVGGFEDVRERVVEEQRWRKRYEGDQARRCWMQTDLQLAAYYGYEPEITL
jgi:hypothetical protein